MSERFTWTPEEITRLTMPQILLYISPLGDAPGSVGSSGGVAMNHSQWSAYVEKVRARGRGSKG